MRIHLDKNDKLFSEFIRKRAVKLTGGCEYCGKKMGWKDLQCSHFHGRRKRSVRYDPENACGVCFSCHLHLGENPYIHTEFFRKRLGSEKFEQLNIRAQQISKIDKDAVTKYLKEFLEAIE